jgi:peroxiredoxin
MKRLLLALLFPAVAFAQGDNGYTVKGQIKGLKDSTLVYLSNMSGTPIAQTYSSGGAFKLMGKLESGDVYQLSFIGYPDISETFLTNENLTVTGTASAMKSLTVTGSTAAQDYQLYLKRFNPLKERLNTGVAKANQAPAGKQRDSLVTVVNKTVADIQSQIDLFIKEKPASQVSAFILYVTNQLNGDVSVLEKRFSKLTASAKNNMYGKALSEMIEQQKTVENFGAIGSTAPDFVQNDAEGKPVSLSSFRGKYVLIDFWASWCGPCRRENPAVVAAYNEFKNKNFTILGVSLDQDKAKWLEAIQHDGLTWTHVSDLAYWNNAVAKKYQVTGIPINYLIDPQGKIVAKSLRGEELRETLAKILK